MNTLSKLLKINILAAISLLYIFSGCSKKSVEMPDVISSHTSGVVSVKSPIRVNFQFPVIGDNEVGKNVPEKLVTFSPKAEGKAFWISQTAFEFIPENSFESDKEYKCKLDLRALSDTLKTSYEFSFRTLKPSVSFLFQHILATEFDNNSGYTLVGTLVLTDYVSFEKVQNVIDAKIDKRNLKVDYQQTTGLNINITIDSIYRSDNEQVLKINFDGSAINAKEKSEFVLNIPPVNEFRHITGNVLYQPEPVIVISFSDILQANQDLTGLIQLNGKSPSQVVVDKNVVRVYPRITEYGDIVVEMFRGIRSAKGMTMAQNQTFTVHVEREKPQVRKSSSKIISAPTQQGALFEFEAARLKAVDVRIYQIFQNNIIQFLQVNDYQDNWELERVGKVVYQSTINIEGQAESTHQGWSKYYLDLSKLVEKEIGALYHVQIGFRKQHAIWDCSESEEKNRDDINDTDFWDRFDDYSYGEYSWDYSDNPCEDAYYGFRRAIKHNYISSNIGLIAKRDGKNQLTVFATTINQNQPLSKCVIKVLNYQQQVLAEVETNSEGKAEFTDMEEAYFVIAETKEDRNYLRIPPYESLSVSNFDVEGVETRDGINAFAFTERDVYRPGDTVFVGFIINDALKTIPPTHPIQVYVTNSNGQPEFETSFQYKGESMHRIDIPTAPDALTGRWTIRFTIGKKQFYKRVRIETIRPNRMEIIHDIAQTTLNQNFTANILVKWLHGGSAANQDFAVDAVTSAFDIRFSSLKGYTFNNPYVDEYAEEWSVLKTKLNNEGKTSFRINLPSGLKSSAYKTTYTFRATEPGGQFTTSSAQTVVSPYNNLTGMKLPEPDGQWGQFQSGKQYSVSLILTDLEGKTVARNQNVKVNIYKRNWQWWYQSSRNDYSYMTGANITPVISKNVSINGGSGSFDFAIKDDWGYYQIYVENNNTGQVVAGMIRVGDDGYSGSKTGKDASIIELTLDKEEYALDETITLTFPSSQGGKALVSLENGSEIIKSEWIETTDNYTTYTTKATAAMSPNFYFNVTFLQPFEKTVNDLPLRLYGIIPCKVVNPESQLFPKIDAPDKSNCNEPFVVKVSEQNGKEMRYMLAVVDEGLLGITSYKTPNPWEYFHKKVALGVTSWDLFDWVMGAMSGVVGRVIGIGGDDGEVSQSPASLNTQFKAVVKVLGPFNLKKRGSDTHKIELPSYLGAVRVMAIASTEKSWGVDDKRVTITSPLLITASTPRVLTPGDKFDIPLNIFGSEETQRKINIEVKNISNLSLAQNNVSVTLDNNFRGTKSIQCNVKSIVGQAALTIEATDGKHKATYDIKIPIENPTPVLYEVENKSLSTDDSWKVDVKPIGAQLTNSAVLELSTLPPIDLEKHLDFLIRYPYGCLEQTTSIGFPLLYVDKLIDLEEDRKNMLNSVLSETIKRIYGFQDATGVLNYWQGTTCYYEWADIYAGDFLIEAEKKGHAVDQNVMNSWLKVQRQIASKWVDKGAVSRFNQAYRLYVLARANKADVGAMNRLRNSKESELQTNLMLAMAYAENGRAKTARELISTSVSSDNEKLWRYTFGSSVRDISMKVLALLSVENNTEAFDLLLNLSEELSKRGWHSTQSIGFMLRAIGTYVTKAGLAESIEVKYSINKEKEKTLKTKNPFARIEIPIQGSENQTVTVTNKSKAATFARLINSGKPMPSDIEAVSNSLIIRDQYVNSDNRIIDITNIKQGDDFIAEIIIENPATEPNLENVAIEFTAPAGIEIINPRLTDSEDAINESSYTYRDYRDNKVYTFTDLRSGEKKVFRFRINATFVGEFYFPPVYCSQMYNDAINARTESKVVRISK